MSKFLLISLTILLFFSLSMAQTYVGPEKCLQCHNNVGLGDMTGWRTSMHANGYSVVLDDSRSMDDLYGIINDYDQNGIDDFKDGLDFNAISSAFDPFKPNAPILAYDAVNGYTITIGTVTSRVYLTYGGSGHYKQRYVMKILTSEGESADHYISPIQYNEKTFEYVLYHADDYWVYNGGVPSNVPVFTSSSTRSDISTNSRSMTKGCAGCHVTGITINAQNADGEWTMSGGAIDPATLPMYTDNNIYDFDGDGTPEQLNTGCERCHGPGGDHVAGPSSSNIINPDSLSATEANNICGMCHSRGKSKPNNTFSFPYHDDTLTSWAVGDLVEPIYTDGGGYWGDGTSSKKHHQQFHDFYKSSKPTFVYHEVTCFECHDVHNEVKHHVREEIMEEDSLGNPIAVATENDNNTLCLACHTTHGAFEDIPVEWVADYANHINDIGTVVSAHTRHSYDPEGNGASRCSKCHNPKTIKSAIQYDIHSHTFEPMPPQKTKTGVITSEMPNACAVSCHMKSGYNTFGIDFTSDDLGDWSEATDQALADTLMHWYGPGGIWWDLDITGIDGEFDIRPETFSLSQNYPNPFNPTTKINFSVAKTGKVQIVIYNTLGQKVFTLVNANKLAGNYTIELNASQLASGLYFYEMITGDYRATKKMLVMK